MNAKCAICDAVVVLDQGSFQAKRLRNRQEKMFLCPACSERIEQRTKARHATGQFKLYRNKKKKRQLIK